MAVVDSAVRPCFSLAVRMYSSHSDIGNGAYEPLYANPPAGAGAAPNYGATQGYVR